jgi:hypothetical protein
MNRDRYQPSDYMYWVTDNVNTLITGQKNLVACVYCRDVYNTASLPKMHNCLVCNICGIDAVMVINEESPLSKMTDAERQAQLDEWHAKGFTPLPRKKSD